MSDAEFPKATVLMVAFQAGPFMPSAIAQLVGIPRDDVEILLVDDGSTDDTLGQMREYEARDKRARVIALPRNVGLGAARTVGFHEARGEFIWNVDADDEWPADGLDALLMESDGMDVVIGAAIRRRGTRDTVLRAPWLPERADGGDALRALYEGRATGHLWNKLIRREIVQGDARTDARIHSDLIIVSKILSSTRAVAVTQRIVYVYVETHGSNIRSRQPRGASLEQVELSIRESARLAHLDRTASFKAFFARVVVLSRLRDAVRGDYPVDEAESRLRDARSKIRFSHIVALIRTGRLRESGQLAVGWVFPALFARIMNRSA